MNDSVRQERTESIRRRPRTTPSGSICLVFALTTIIVGALLPVELWPIHGVLLVVVFILLTLWDIPIAWIWRRLKWFVPLITLFAISVPLSQGFGSGLELMTAIIIRGTLSFMTVLWLSRAVPFPELLRTLQAWHVPDLLLAMLSMMHRYSVVLWNELNSMRTARRARLFKSTTIRTRWLSNARMIGMLLIRSLTRAERIHSAMMARGWNGTLHDFEFEPTDSNP
jgi:cobalt/nickel transport system permease protein